MIFTAFNATQIREEMNDKIILLPLGAVEQHGPHLGVGTDTDIVSAVAIEAEKIMREGVMLCPTLPFGSSHHHLSFGGTISIEAGLYTQIIFSLVESLLISGCRKIVLLNGHGGNITPVKQALSLLSNRYDASMQPNIILATYWELAAKVFAGLPPMESPALSHACEYETSMMLHLFPEKVWLQKAVRATRPESNGYIAWEDDEPYKGVSMVKQTPFISDNGSSGEPQLATMEKGAHLFNHAVEALVQLLISFKSWPFLQKLSQ